MVNLPYIFKAHPHPLPPHNKCPPAYLQILNLPIPYPPYQLHLPPLPTKHIKNPFNPCIYTYLHYSPVCLFLYLSPRRHNLPQPNQNKRNFLIQPTIHFTSLLVNLSIYLPSSLQSIASITCHKSPIYYLPRKLNSNSPFRSQPIHISNHNFTHIPNSQY